jgi:hypothetical protein
LFDSTSNKNDRIAAMTIAAEGPILRQEEEEQCNDESEAIFLLPAGGRDESCCASEQHYVESGNEKMYCIYSVSV